MQAPLSGIGGLGWGEDGGTSRICPQTLQDMGGFCEISGNPFWFLAAPSWRSLGLPTSSPFPASPSGNSLVPGTSPQWSPRTLHPLRALLRGSIVIYLTPLPAQHQPRHLLCTLLCPGASPMSSNYCFNFGDGKTEAQRGGDIYLKSQS